MLVRTTAISVAALAAGLLILFTPPAEALTMKECSASPAGNMKTIQNPTGAFPYYVLRIAADLDLDQTVTWNVVSFRYREGFDPDDHYNTPQIATGFTYKLDGQSSISAKIMRNWREGDPSSTGVALGFRQQF